MGRVNSFKDLVVWQIADELFKMIVEDIDRFPRTQVARIIGNQILRSIASIGANIAEGSGRGGRKELIRYLIIARGSLTESEDWLHKLLSINYISLSRKEIYDIKLNELRIKINALIGSLRMIETTN